MFIPLITKADKDINDIKLSGVKFTSGDVDYLSISLCVKDITAENAELALYLYRESKDSGRCDEKYIQLEDCLVLQAIPHAAIDCHLLFRPLLDGGPQDAVEAMLSFAAASEAELHIVATERRKIRFELAIGKNFSTEATVEPELVSPYFVLE